MDETTGKKKAGGRRTLFAELLVKARRAKAWTQKDAAQMLGVNQQAVARAERGHYSGKLVERGLENVARIMEIPYEKLSRAVQIAADKLHKARKANGRRLGKTPKAARTPDPTRGQSMQAGA